MTESTARLVVGGRAVEVPAGTPLHIALNEHGFHVETPCGARGTCRKCRVRLGGDVPPPSAADREHLSPAELELGFRLSCQHRAAGVLEVAILPGGAADPRKAGLGRLSGHVPVEPWAPLHLAPRGARPVGLAVDLGTTTIVAALLDLETGEELGAATLPNPQSVYGADLMSRLTHAMAGPDERRALQALAVRAVAYLSRRLLRRAGLPPEAAVAAAVVGNTAMHHLFLGLPVEGLAVAPYRPVVRGGLDTPAAALGDLGIHPQAPVHTLPVVAGFVGADAVACALAAGLDRTGETVLVVDIGTNGEAVLAHRGELWAASAPAGPAFEGGELSMGMRAGPGAVESVEWDGAGLRVGVAGGDRAVARGVCGSGLLDAAQVLLATGALDPDGRLHARGPLAGRIREGAWEGLAFVLAEPPGEPTVVLTQRDLRQLQLAKGAVRSGVEVLLRSAGVTPAELDAVLLAGGFGNYLRREAALATGLLPQVPPERVVPAGNLAAQGAKLALLSREARRRAAVLAQRIRHVDLATHPDFEAVFMAALAFPAGVR
ncbi:ASKHA domain-containing protein [Caldinitratiruptor microaerophilus]|uniref:2Fe-2S ferredoxin-type domain-containing protein n=1 Tax=Caldinitratiruptor microaerophilus TaxID=671077 RepID=A0AA35CM65_9FIRM|nr:ASKHA domain-containing protein [Caldinitratiruptor microaerophilus]BDG61029.1 hypothetical protein caldi_21190 [Caldinitratiruptor microaerophilus]